MSSISANEQDSVNIEFGALQKGPNVYFCDAIQLCPKERGGSYDQSNFKQTDYDDIIKGNSSQYVCDICWQQFSTKGTLKRHRLIHLGVEPTPCEECGKLFYEKSALDCHLRVHKGEKPLICDTCKKGFPNKSSLSRHRRIHAGIKPHLCNVCGKRFTERTTFNRHIRTHTGEKPFSCVVCQKSFSVKSSLMCHMDIHAGVKRFICEICKKEFLRKSSFDRHHRVHAVDEQFACDECPKRFTTQLNLITHLRSHSGEKPFSCDICNRKFSDMTSCKRHRNIHQVENQIPCDICQKRFTTLSNMKFHKRIHARETPYIRKRKKRADESNKPENNLTEKKSRKTKRKASSATIVRKLPRMSRNAPDIYTVSDKSSNENSDGESVEMCNAYTFIHDYNILGNTSSKVKGNSQLSDNIDEFLDKSNTDTSSKMSETRQKNDFECFDNSDSDCNKVWNDLPDAPSCEISGKTSNEIKNNYTEFFPDKNAEIS